MRRFRSLTQRRTENHMDAEHLNAIANQLDDLDSRGQELRRYL